MEVIDEERIHREAFLEIELVKKIETIHEYPKVDKIPQFVREFVVNFCCDNKLSVDDALEFANSTIKKSMVMKRNDIIPDSKRGKDFLIRMTLIHRLLEKNSGVAMIFDEAKTNEMEENFCAVTGIDKEMVHQIVTKEAKQAKRRMIERDIYGFIEKNVLPIENPTTRKAASEKVINESAEILKLEPKYIKSVLREQKKKIEAERKRIEEFRANQAKLKSDNEEVK